VINDLKDLQKLLKLCRSQGVTEIDLGTVKLKLGDMPQTEQSVRYNVQDDVPSDNPYANFPQGILTPEQLMFYSSGGDPANDPALASGDQ